MFAILYLSSPWTFTNYLQAEIRFLCLLIWYDIRIKIVIFFCLPWKPANSGQMKICFQSLDDTICQSTEIKWSCLSRRFLFFHVHPCTAMLPALYLLLQGLTEFWQMPHRFQMIFFTFIFIDDSNKGSILTGYSSGRCHMYFHVQLCQCVIIFIHPVLSPFHSY